MAKKNKKIFKQKIKEMMAQVETPVQTVQGEVKAKIQTQTETLPSELKTSSDVASVVRSDLKKIGILLILMAAIIVAAYFVSNRTNWITVLADKIYNWAQLGA